MSRLYTLLLLVTLISCNETSKIEQVAAENAAKAEREEMMATLINLRGYLCARVIFVSPELSSGERQVNCEEYRDKAKARTKNNMAVYMVNLTNGEVKFVRKG